jgi:hypothetical protein
MLIGESSPWSCRSVAKDRSGVMTGLGAFYAVFGLVSIVCAIGL